MAQHPMKPHEELLAFSKTLQSAASPPELEAAEPGLDALDGVVDQIGRSFSGSWLGYHARVYYADLKPAPRSALQSRMGDERDVRRFRITR